MKQPKPRIIDSLHHALAVKRYVVDYFVGTMSTGHYYHVRDTHLGSNSEPMSYAAARAKADALNLKEAV